MMSRSIFILFFIAGLSLATKSLNADSISEGLVAFYPLKGNDERGNQRHGTVKYAIPVPDRLGNENCAYEFDGNTSLIDCGDILNDPELPFTVSAWIKCYSNDIGQLLFYTLNNAGQGTMQASVPLIA